MLFRSFGGQAAAPGDRGPAARGARRRRRGRRAGEVPEHAAPGKPTDRGCLLCVFRDGAGAWEAISGSLGSGLAGFRLFCSDQLRRPGEHFLAFWMALGGEIDGKFCLRVSFSRFINFKIVMIWKKFRFWGPRNVFSSRSQKDRILGLKLSLLTCKCHCFKLFFSRFLTHGAPFNIIGFNCWGFRL